MPEPVIKKSSPIYKSGVSLWHSRYMFIYAGGEQLIGNRTNIFYQLDTQNYYRGGYNVPNSFFIPGNVFRIRGHFIANVTGGGSTLNIDFGLRNVDSDTYYLAQSNFGNNHEISGGLSNVPVDFEFIINCMQIAKDPGLLQLSLHGYYSYNLDFNNGGNNLNNAKIPVVSDYGSPPIIQTTNESGHDFVFRIDGADFILRSINVEFDG